MLRVIFTPSRTGALVASLAALALGILGAIQ